MIISFNDQTIDNTSFLESSSILCFSKTSIISSIAHKYSAGLIFIPLCVVGHVPAGIGYRPTASCTEKINCMFFDNR